ncbi:MAG: hypothetical protein HY350_01785, partial [Candidatus Omnitrophica bacterium]|nr:hypothetical protein [Candidatus Omnitrophota bacterium]
LTADPQSPKADAARKEYERIKTAAWQKVSAIFKTARSAVDQIQTSEYSEFSDAATFKSVALSMLSRYEASAGLISEALTTSQHSELNQDAKEHTAELINDSWSAYIQSVLEGGDVDRAAKALAQINLPDLPSSDYILSDMSSLYLQRGELDIAWKAARQIKDLKERAGCLANIAAIKLRDGDFVPAKEALAIFPGPNKDELSLSGYHDFYNALLLEAVANKYLELNNIPDALETARQFHTYTRVKGELLANIAWAKFNAGDTADATKIAKEILELGTPDDKNRYEPDPGINYETASMAYILSGDYTNAVKLGNISLDALNGLHSFATIIYVKMILGDINGAKRTTEELIKIDQKSKYPDTGKIYAGLACGQLKRELVKETLDTLRKKTEYPFYDDVFIHTVNDRLKTGQIAKAVEIAELAQREFPDEKLHSQLIACIVHAQILSGDTENTGKTAATVTDIKNRLPVLLYMTDAYIKTNAKPDALRVLAEATAIVDPASNSYNRDRYYPKDFLNLKYNASGNELLSVIARQQEIFGDSEGARITKGRIQPEKIKFGKGPEGRWIELADELSRELYLINAEKALSEVKIEKKDPQIGIDSINSVGEKLGKTLLRVEGLEAQLRYTKEGSDIPKK